MAGERIEQPVLANNGHRPKFTAKENAEFNFKWAKESPQAFNEFKKDLERQLHELDGKNIENESLKNKCQRGLDVVARSIELLKENYPEDTDVKLFEAMYLDLKGDFENAKQLRLDSGYDSIVLAMQKDIKDSGVREESPDNTILGATVESLRKAGVNPEYVVTSGNPSAKTVVLFMQIHPNPGATKVYMDGIGITSSQDEIYRDATNIVNSGIGKLIYTEGCGAGEELPVIKDEDLKEDSVKVDAGIRLRRDLDDKKVVVVGAEPAGLVGSTFRRACGGDKSAFNHRLLAQNVLIANAIVDDMNTRSDNFGMVIYGGAHEKSPSWSPSTVLPLSKVLAAMGLNVVVVDRMSGNITEEKMKANKAGLKKVGQEICLAVAGE